MKTIERQDSIPTTINDIKAEDLFKTLQEQYSVTPKQKLKITFEVITAPEEEIDDSEFDIENLGDSVLESLEEIVEAKKKGVKLPNARDLLNEL